MSTVTGAASRTGSRAVVATSFGGPEVLQVKEVPEPHADQSQLRVRAAAAGLNPMDWLVVTDEVLGSAFGVHPLTGFGYDFSGVVDEVGEGVNGFAVVDRVFGGAMSRRRRPRAHRPQPR